jgi:hypothetical protein
VQINQLASAKQIECLQKILRYPPFMEGLLVRSATKLLASQLQLATIQQCYALPFLPISYQSRQRIILFASVDTHVAFDCAQF